MISDKSDHSQFVGVFPKLSLANRPLLVIYMKFCSQNALSDQPGELLMSHCATLTDLKSLE